MPAVLAITLLRRPAVLAALGLKGSTLFEHIERGVMVPPVKLGQRVAVWPSYEVERIVAARVAGWDDTQMRKLVQQLVELRTHAVEAAA